MNKLQKTVLAIVWISLLISSGLLVYKKVRAMEIPAWAGSEEVSKPEKISNKLSVFSRIFNIILDNYYREIEADTLLQAAIDGMVSKLDPNTQYMKKQDVDRLTEDTKGKYGGLGIMISSKSNRILVITPFDGSPAAEKGIRAGDLILKINDTTTYKMNMDEAVSKMRGDVGTDVKLTIKRISVPEPFDVTITRDEINAPNIQNAFITNGDIGYLKLTRFTKDVKDELKVALTSLKEQGMKKVILDLRNNPGGLLNAAYEVSDVFLEKGEKIVYTVGRMPDQNRVFIAREDPFIKDMPLIIMVNEGSASASEIVAGAVQDWDKGLIVGDTSFGKGSVQTLTDLSDNEAFKFTAARYFTPSGRCIHKEENWFRNSKDSWDYYMDAMDEQTDDASVDEESAEEDSTNFNWDKFLDSLNIKKPSFYEKDTATTDYWKDSLLFVNGVIKEHKVFKTNAGRIVYGGGGITPDVVVKREDYSDLLSFLIRNNLFLDYSANYLAAHKDLNPDNLVITAEMMDEFYEHGKKAYDQTVETWATFKIKNEKKNGEDGTTIIKLQDNTKNLLNSLLVDMQPVDSIQYNKLLRDLRKLVNDGYYFYFTRDDFNTDSTIIKAYLKAEMVKDLYADKGQADKGNELRYEMLIQFDTQLQEAIKILSKAKDDADLLSVVMKH
jgi:carboxyl-terminal processing protease